MNIEFSTTEYSDCTIVEFQIGGDGVLAPTVLDGLVPPDVAPSKGVVLSGRGPVWLFCHLAHHYHPTAWVGTFAPSEGGAVVIARHTRNAPAIGSVVPLPKAE
jgi:CRISPR-associated protein Csx3